MNDFELVKFSVTTGGVVVSYRMTHEIDGVPYENEYSVVDTRQMHPDLLVVLHDFDVFLGDVLGADSKFAEIKFSGLDERRAAIVKAKMETALGLATVKLPKVRFAEDDRERAVDMSVCCSRLEDEVAKFLFENKVGELTAIDEL